MSVVSVAISSYMEHDPDDPLGGGYVKIRCECGYVGFVDVDDTGSAIQGSCEECLTYFSHSMF